MLAMTSFRSGEMLAMTSLILAITLFTSVDGNLQQTATAELPRVGRTTSQRRLNHETAFVKHTNHQKLPKLPAPHMASISIRQRQVPQVKHKKKPGAGYEKGSPLYEKQARLESGKAMEIFHPGPSRLVILAAMFLGTVLLVVAAYVNRDFLVRRHLEKGELPVQPLPLKPDTSFGYDRSYQERRSSTGVEERSTGKPPSEYPPPVRTSAIVEKANQYPTSTRFDGTTSSRTSTLSDRATYLPGPNAYQQRSIPASTMPSQQQPYLPGPNSYQQRSMPASTMPPQQQSYSQ